MKMALQQFAAYNLWANSTLGACIRELPPEVQMQQVVNSFTSLHATLLHLWDAESIWWQRLKLQEQVVRPSDGFTGDTNAVLKALLDSSKQWAEWVQDAQPHMLKHEFIYQNTKREKFKQPVYLMLLHLFNHGTYHRGQLVTLLRQLQVAAIPATDFILWSRSRSLKELG
jgi:uncharacterized damage-inducible protein DinB